MEELWDQGGSAIFSLMKCLVSEPGSFRQKNYMIITAISLHRISRLVYFKEGRYQKLPIEKYYYYIFEGDAETPEEVCDWIKTLGRNCSWIEQYGITQEKANHIFKLIWQIADLVCPMMACNVEQAFVSEYAYAIEYVIHHNGDLPKPKILELFPTNYPDYEYDAGIAKTIRDYDVF